jgi:hypothetical protein
MLSPRSWKPIYSCMVPMDVRGIKIALVVRECPCGVASFNAYACM